METLRPVLETLTQVSSTQVPFCEICEIFKKTFFEEHLKLTACVE